jgi:hypothetical protein
MIAPMIPTLAQWYQDHLGVFVTPQSDKDPVWQQQAGSTSFTPFPEKTNYFGDATKQWMINFRVGDLDGAERGCRLPCHRKTNWLLQPKFEQGFTGHRYLFAFGSCG